MTDRHDQAADDLAAHDPAEVPSARRREPVKVTAAKSEAMALQKFEKRGESASQDVAGAAASVSPAAALHDRIADKASTPVERRRGLRGENVMYALEVLGLASKTHQAQEVRNDGENRAFNARATSKEMGGAASVDPDAILAAAARDGAPAFVNTAEDTDAAFFANRRNGHVAFAAGLWLSLGAMCGAIAAAKKMPMDPAASGAIAVAVGIGLYAFLQTVLALMMGHGLERKLNEIRRTARIGCERLRIDDGPLMATAIRDVLGEWMHMHRFEVRLRDRNALVAIAYVLQALVTVVAIVAFIALGEFDVASTAMTAGVATVLTAAHLWLHLSRLRREVIDVRPTDHDPTQVLATRLSDLLTEVKELRKHGVRH